MLAMFYQKLAMVFWKSQDYVFHAQAWHKLFAISKDHKKTFSTEEAQYMASCVLLSTLSIPILNSGPEMKKIDPLDNFSTDRQLRLSELVGINTVPTRSDLVQSLISNKIMKYVDPELKDLYSWLEEEFHPLHLAHKVAPILQYVSKQAKLQHYVKPLQRIVMVRLLKQLSQIYSSIKLERLQKLVPFANQFEIEAFVVQAAKDHVVQYRINHRNQCINFGTSTLVASGDQTDDGQ